MSELIFLNALIEKHPLTSDSTSTLDHCTLIIDAPDSANLDTISPSSLADFLIPATSLDAGLVKSVISWVMLE